MFCGGLLAALAAGAPVAGTAGGAVAAALAAGASAVRGRAGAALALLGAAVALAGWAWGTVRLAATAAPRLDLPARASGVVVVNATPAPDGRGGVRARAVASRLTLAPGGPVPDGTRLLLDLDDGRSPPGLGDRLRVEGRMRPAADRDDPGWWRRWLARQGIAGRLRPDVAAPAGRRGGLEGCATAGAGGRRRGPARASRATAASWCAGWRWAAGRGCRRRRRARSATPASGTCWPSRVRT